MQAIVIASGKAAAFIEVPDHEPQVYLEPIPEDEGQEPPPPIEPELVALDLAAYAMTLGLQLAPMVDGVSIGDDYDAETETFSSPAIDLDSLRAAALANIAEQRWEATQFFTFDGVRTQADQAIGVISARLVLRRETGIPDAYEMVFKLADGEVRSWDKAAEVAFGQALAAHVQGCFDIEAGLTEAMVSAATPAAIDALVETARISWPD